MMPSPTLRWQIEMASERQIAANRRNAKKSTGPRTLAGKQRSSRNALKHGLSVPAASTELNWKAKELLRQLTGGLSENIILSSIEKAAAADVELARIERLKQGLINCAAELTYSDAALSSAEWPRAVRLELTVVEAAGAQAKAGCARQTVAPSSLSSARFIAMNEGLRGSATEQF
jgi:hypothetical protein